MAVNKYATDAGKKFEADLMKHLREEGFDAERLRLSGSEDEGDLVIRTPTSHHPLIIEAKRTKRMNIGGWVKEAQTERDNYAKHRGLQRPPHFVVVHYARGKGLGGSYVTTTMDEFTRWL